VPPKRKRSRSPSPIPRSPPRNVRPNRPPGRGRNVLAEAARLAEERERERQQANRTAQAARGVQDVSNQFYNARPEWVKEKGRDWRRNESKIKGLRNFNNWIKSTIIQKFSPEEMPQQEELGWGEEPKEPEARKPLLVLDIGCGKGGDLGKWQLAPQTVGLYVGLDPADQSIEQARDRYMGMRRGRRPIFDGRFHVKDCFGEWIGEVPIVKEVGIDPNAGGGGSSRWGGGGQFDVVSMMFSMHYAFESEEKVKMMLRNVAGSLKKGGRFIGVVPNSDALASRVVEWHKKQNQSALAANGETSQEKDEPSQDSKEAPKEELGPSQDSGKAPKETHEASPDGGDAPKHKRNPSENDDETPKKRRKIEENGQSVEEPSAPQWGNTIYRVRFPIDTDRPTAPDGTFRPPFSWKYMYWMDEAVDVPEYVVPWEAFRALAEGFNLEQRYRKPFLDIWDSEKDDRDLAPLSVRMGVRKYEGGPLEITEEEREAVSFYHAFCFVKV
jgi:mRNA (guanine-N7-)-methyltransferase